MKILKKLTSLAFVLSLGATACSADTSSDDRDDGTGTGGTSGTGGTGECEVPACVLEMYLLVTGCVGTGTCVAQQTETGVNQCYSDGRKMIVNLGETNTGIQLLNADGSVCVTEELAIGEGGRGIVTIKDGSGETLGTLVTNGEVLESASCDGNVYPASTFACDDDDDDTGGGVECTMGTCA